MGEFYKLTEDMEQSDRALAENVPYMYAEACNIDEISSKGGIYKRLKHADFQKIDYPWPEVIFWYSSKASSRECDYLDNIRSWPLVHRRVMDIFNNEGIHGVSYYPIKLIDVCTDEINDNYYMLHADDFIDAFDMEKSKYEHVVMEEYGIDAYTFIPMKTVLNRANCEGNDIFRPDKDTVSLIVSEKVKRIVEDNGFTGFGFSLLK